MLRRRTVLLTVDALPGGRDGETLRSEPARCCVGRHPVDSPWWHSRPGRNRRLRRGVVRLSSNGAAACPGGSRVRSSRAYVALRESNQICFFFKQKTAYDM